MAKMISLPTPIPVDVAEGWSVVAVSAGLYSLGLRADLHSYNGELADSDMVFLSSRQHREDFAAVVAGRCGAEMRDVCRALLSLKEQIEGQLRELAEGVNSQSP
jgi:hypothetical protein